MQGSCETGVASGCEMRARDGRPPYRPNGGPRLLSSSLSHLVTTRNSPSRNYTQSSHSTLGEMLVNLSLVLGLLSLLLWILLAFILHVPAGWPHLFLAAGVILLIRRVVTGRSAW
jgi:hypothetical protein